jgi:hypothetical protein
MRPAPYADTIRRYLPATRAEVDPRHVEGFIRLEHRTLSGLTPRQWRAEVAIALGCLDAGGVAEAEANAQSFGL